MKRFSWIIWAHGITRVLRSERERQESQSWQFNNGSRTWSDVIVGFEGGRRWPRAKERRRPVATGAENDWGFPLVSRRNATPPPP